MNCSLISIPIWPNKLIWYCSFWIKFVTCCAFGTWVQSIFILVLRLITHIKINVQIVIQIFSNIWTSRRQVLQEDFLWFRITIRINEFLFEINKKAGQSSRWDTDTWRQIESCLAPSSWTQGNEQDSYNLYDISYNEPGSCFTLSSELKWI